MLANAVTYLNVDTAVVNSAWLFVSSSPLLFDVLHESAKQVADLN